MTWYVVRHARKEQGDFYNPSLRHQDEPLSAEGREQARKLAGYMAEKPISAIYVSAYVRTLQTAACTAEQLGINPVIDARLNEIDNGLVGAMSEAEFGVAYPVEYAAYMRRSADFRFPGGETGTEVRERIAAFEREKRVQHAGQDILVVAHDGLIRSWMCYLMELPVYRRADFQIDFCGLMEIDYQEEYGRWKLIRFNHPCG
jgi:broad specificity phosphatase PhoE